MFGQNGKTNNKCHCHLLQQHAPLETRGPITTLLDAKWTPSGLSAHLPFIIINAKRGTGPLWRGTYWETHSRAGPLRVHSGPLGSPPIGEIDASSPLESTWVHFVKKLMKKLSWNHFEPVFHSLQIWESTTFQRATKFINCKRTV